MRELAEHEELSQYFHLTREALMHYCFSTPVRLEMIVTADEENVVGAGKS